MRISVLAFGSRGDTQPCVALAQGLALRGHDVTVVAAERYASLMSTPTSDQNLDPKAPKRGISPRRVSGEQVGGGLAHAPLSVDPVAIVESEEGQAWLRSGPLGFVRGFRTVVEPLAERLVAEVDAACAKADLVLAPALCGFGRHLRDRYGTPYMLLHFQPSEPTSEFPNPLIDARSLGALGNRVSYALIERLSWLVLARMVNRLRGSVLGLAPMRGSPFAADRRDRVPVLCGVSPHVVARPRDWPEHVHLTGYWRVAGERLPGDLEAFLRAGPKPVYMGFGSMAGRAPVLSKIEGRVVVQGLAAEPSDDVFVAGDVPHDLLFPRMAAIVHHGGAGTTGAGLTAGVPNIVCPFFADQPFWARRVAALGAGPPVGADLRERLLAVPQYVEKSAQLGRLLEVEDGVKTAVDLIEQY